MKARNTRSKNEVEGTRTMGGGKKEMVERNEAPLTTRVEGSEIFRRDPEILLIELTIQIN